MRDMDLEVGALVVVDAHEAVPGRSGQVRHQRRLPARRRALPRSNGQSSSKFILKLHYDID